MVRILTLMCIIIIPSILASKRDECINQQALKCIQESTESIQSNYLITGLYFKEQQQVPMVQCEYMWQVMDNVTSAPDWLTVNEATLWPSIIKEYDEHSVILIQSCHEHLPEVFTILYIIIFSIILYSDIELVVCFIVSY